MSSGVMLEKVRLPHSWVDVIPTFRKNIHRRKGGAQQDSEKEEGGGEGEEFGRSNSHRNEHSVK